MKTTKSKIRYGGMLAILLLALGVGVEVVNADFTFGEPVNLGPPINSPSREVAFILSADGLEMYVSSERSGGLGYIDMWRSTRENADSPWGPPVNVQEINSPYDEAFPCLSADGLTLYFSDWYYWSAAGDRPGGVGGHDLWMSTRASRNDPWGTPVNMGAPLNSGNNDICPAISHDGLTFIFASTRSGGFGDYDLWMSTRPTAESEWAEPVNMGLPVNSSAGEVELWLSPDGLVLLFCSDRSGGMGSYDMWLATRPSQAAAWGPPVNLGPPVNTGGMEGVPSLSPDSKTLYFGRGDWEAYEAPIVPIVDFNGDGIVDAADMCIMVDHWGEDEPSCDVGPTPWGDGIVDLRDLVLLTEYWLADYRLIAHWKLDETEDAVAHDSAGDKDGTLNGDPNWQPAGGKIGGALQLDGIDDYVSTELTLNPVDGPFSVFAWVKGGAPGQVIISQKDRQVGRSIQPGSTWLGTDTSDGRLMTALMEVPFGPLESQSVITDRQWHHVALVYDLDGLCRRLYVDGVEVAEDTNAVGGVDSSGSLHIGAGKDLDASSFFWGLIDDVRIYNAGLSAKEIEELAR